MPGWSEDLTAMSRFSDLPVAAQAYAKRIFDGLGVQQGSVSVGPGREQTIEIDLRG